MYTQKCILGRECLYAITNLNGHLPIAMNL